MKKIIFILVFTSVLLYARTQDFNQVVREIRDMELLAHKHMLVGNNSQAADLYINIGEKWISIGYGLLGINNAFSLEAVNELKNYYGDYIYLKDSWLDSVDFYLKKAEGCDKNIWKKEGCSSLKDYYYHRVENFSGFSNDWYLRTTVRKLNSCYLDIEPKDLRQRLDLYCQELRTRLDVAWTIAKEQLSYGDSLISDLYFLRNHFAKDTNNLSVYIKRHYDIGDLGNNDNYNTFVYVINNFAGKDNFISRCISDGILFSNICEFGLGISDEHVLFQETNLSGFVDCIESIKQASVAYDGNLNVVVYYSGPAFTNPVDKEPYFIPSDGNFEKPETCYSLNRFIKELGTVNAKSVLCFLETGFENRNDTEKTSIVIEPTISRPQGNLVLFTATSDSREAFKHIENNYGLFTYYLAEKINSTSYGLTLGELYDYAYSSVKKYTFNNTLHDMYGAVIQTPTVLSSTLMESKWRKIWVFGDENREAVAEINGSKKTNQSDNNHNMVNDDDSTPDSDIDTGIPQISFSNIHTHVMIIANQDYSSEKNIPTALNDGRLMKEYCISALGIPANQVTLMENRTSVQMSGDVEDFAKTIKIHNNDRFLFFYFGHGMHSQDMSVEDAYLLPVDGSSQRLQKTGISRNWIMEQFGKAKPSQMVVYLESCFSGATFDNDMLSYSENSSGVRIKDVVDNTFEGNIILLTASSLSETANALYRHNVFTYAFLKELQKSADNLTWGVLFDKVREETTKKAWDSLKRDQTPSITPSSTIGNGWRGWKLVPDN